MSQPLLSAAAIKAAPDRKEEIVEVPEWGGYVRLVQMTAAESGAFRKELQTLEGDESGMFLMLVYSARNEQNDRIFTVEDVPALKEKNINVLIKLQKKALEINAWGREQLDALKKDLSVAETVATPSPSPVA